MAASWLLTLCTRTFTIQREAENLQILILATNPKSCTEQVPVSSGWQLGTGCGWGPRGLHRRRLGMHFTGAHRIRGMGKTERGVLEQPGVGGAQAARERQET